MVCLQCLDERLEVDPESLHESTIAEIVTDAEKDGSVLPVPFRRDVVSYVISVKTDLQQSTAYDTAVDILRCRKFLGISPPSDRDDLKDHVYVVCMEIVRASGVNLFHFDQAALFMSILEQRDDRIVAVPRLTLESLYWTLVKQNMKMDDIVIPWIGQDVYTHLTSKARDIRHEYNIM